MHHSRVAKQPKISEIIQIIVLLFESMSFTGRADQYGGILRRHDTLGVMYILSFVLQKILTCHTENRAIIAIIDIIDIMLS
jgi:hypothetical protein